MRLAVLASAVLALAGCAGAPAQPGGASAAADPARLYRQKCSGCHRPYEPASRTRAQWQEALARMSPKAHLSPEEEGTLRHFLEARAADGEGAR